MIRRLVIPIDPAKIDLHADEMKKIFRAWAGEDTRKTIRHFQGSQKPE